VDADPPVPVPAGRWRERTAALFPPAAATGLAWWIWVPAVLLGTALSLARVTGTGPFETIFEEDARDILTDALNLSGTRAVLKPAVGYFLIFPRLLGELATFFPLRWAAAVLSISSALVTALLALTVYVASGAHVRNTAVRLLLSVPLLCAPVAENFISEIYNRPVCLHFFALYTLFWVLLWTPHTRGGRVAALAIAGFTATSTILVVALLPLAALRAVLRRDRLGLGMSALLLAGTALHWYATASGMTTRDNISHPRLEPLWALTTFVVLAVPMSVLGFRAGQPLWYVAETPDVLGTQDWLLVGAAWSVIATVIVVAVIGHRRGWLRPNVPLAVLAALHSVGLHCLMSMAGGASAMRYMLPVEVCLYAALALLLVPAGPVRLPASAPVLALAVVVLIAVAFNLRWEGTYRGRSPSWNAGITKAVAACKENRQLQEIIVRTGPEPFWSVVHVPCHEIRSDYRECAPSRCTVVQGLDAPADRRFRE
jgi:hypothetical protein